jgi:predicted lipoprotein with Yx(FWY)xxD motif
MVDHEYLPPAIGPRQATRNRRRPGPGVHGSILASLAAVAGLLLAACGSSGGSAASPGSGGNGQHTAAGHSTVVAVRQVSGVGPVLVDQAGKTLYSPEQEAHGTIRCTSSCLSFWFPVTVPSAHSVPHVTGLGGALGTIRRPDDGKTQLTYKGKPLYTFRLDQSAGQAHGNNFTDSFDGTSFTWQAVGTGGGAASGSGPAHASPSSSAYQGPGY